LLLYHENEEFVAIVAVVFVVIAGLSRTDSVWV